MDLLVRHDDARTVQVEHDARMNRTDHPKKVEPQRRRPWWWLFGAAVLVLMMLVPLTLVAPSNPYLYWFQAFVMGRTDHGRSMVIPPPRGYTGRWLTYHFNLTVDSEMDIVDGKIQGRWRRYREQTGLMWWSGEYAQDLAVGDWYWYDEHGYLIEQKHAPGFQDEAMTLPFMIFWMEF